MRNLQTTTIGALVVTVLLGTLLSAKAQRVRIPSSTAQDASFQGSAPQGPLTPVPSTSPGIPSTTPGITPAPGGATLGQPTFDPYSTAPGSNLPPSLLGTPSTSPYGPAPAISDPNWGSTLGQPQVPAPGTFPPGQAPPSLFPGGWQPGQLAVAGTPLRLIQGPRIQYTWLYGGNERDLGIHDFDTSVVVTFPNFAFSGQPIFVVPSFSLHLWDGPNTAMFAPQTPDLPAQAYSAFLDAYWETDRTRQFGGELGGRVGIFSDFNTVTSDSLRVLAKGLLRYQLTPTLQVRGGVYWVDRARIKLLPAGGLLWEPNPHTRFDVFFPEPKLAQYLTTLGNWDVWWYLGARYGGGHWTVERAVDGMTDRVDLNDIRVFGGLEWGPQHLFQKRRRLAFVEVGWVLDREIIYVRRPQDSVSLSDTIMLRGGIGY